MTKCILWELKYIILFLSKDVSIYSFSNENIDYKKSYTSCYTPKAILIRSHSSAEDN